MKIIELILLLVSATSFLIYEKIPLNTYATKVKKELKEIGALHALEQLEFSDYEYTKDATTYSLSSVQSKAVFFNTNMLKKSVNTQYSVTLSLDWSANSGDTNYLSPYHSIYTAYFSKNANDLKSEEYEIQFELETSVFKFSKTWAYDTEDKFYVSSGKIENTYVSFNAKCLDESCPFTQDILLEAINAFLTENKDTMNDAFTRNGVEAYYKSLPFEELVQKIYTRTSTSISNENNVDLTLEEFPEYTSNFDFIFKRKGKLNDLDVDGDSTFTDTSSFQKFNINKKLIQKIISENLFNIGYEQTTNPSSQYKLNVEYLRQIMDVSDTYSDSTELEVFAEMTDVYFNNEDAISGSVYISVNIVSKSDYETLLTLTLKLGFKFTPTLFQNGLNFVLLAKDLNVEEIRTIENINDRALLQSWIKNTYLVALGNNEFNMFSLAFDLSHFFSTNKISYEFKNEYLSIIKQ